MICPECGKGIPKQGNFCSNCGTAATKKKKKSWAFNLIFFFLLMASALCAAFFFLNLDKKRLPVSETAASAGRVPREASEQKSMPVKGGEPLFEQALKKQKPRFVSGSVIIKNPDGDVVAKIQGMAGGSWIALPTRACIGGDTWVFHEDSYPYASFDIEDGIWSDDDPIGLWKINSGQEGDDDLLTSWDEKRPLFWLSHAPGASMQLVQISLAGRQGMFRFCLIPKNINEPGVFIQNDRVVGWTFGPVFEIGCLFEGTPDNMAMTTMTPDYFYDLTFAFSREQQFSKALAMTPDHSPDQRLGAFAQGFLFESKLSPANTPKQFSLKNVLERMYGLADACFEQRLYMEGANALSPQVLGQALDFGLYWRAVRLAQAAYGYERAMALADEIFHYATRTSDKNKDAITTMYALLCKDYIQWLIMKKDIKRGWEIFQRGKNYFQNDPELHILGVELALAENDWATAENLLAGMPWRPADMKDRMALLEGKIATLKGQEGKIIVRFTPGSGAIETLAWLNNSLEQRFVVDTGATLTSIPFHALEALGIQIDADTPRRRLSTAGKIIIAPEINIPSIEMGGWVERNIKAVVLDIPGHESIGLLGLSYLERFKIDLNTEQGILLLEPL